MHADPRILILRLKLILKVAHANDYHSNKHSIDLMIISNVCLHISMSSHASQIISDFCIGNVEHYSARINNNNNNIIIIIVELLLLIKHVTTIMIIVIIIIMIITDDEADHKILHNHYHGHLSDRVAKVRFCWLVFS